MKLLTYVATGSVIVGGFLLMWTYPIPPRTKQVKETKVFYLIENPAVFYYIANEAGQICRVDKATYQNFLPDECKSGECKTPYVKIEKTYDFETCRGQK